MFRFKRRSGFFAKVELPSRLSNQEAEIVFGRPLRRYLATEGLGRIDRIRATRDRNGEPLGLVLTLSLVTEAPRALQGIARFLESWDAPYGSTIGPAEAPDMFAFGKAQGLALYLDAIAAPDEEAQLEVVEACTDALAGMGLFQGIARMPGTTAIYFYGDDFNQMKHALTFITSTDPRCIGARTARLT